MFITALHMQLFLCSKNGSTLKQQWYVFIRSAGNLNKTTLIPQLFFNFFKKINLQKHFNSKTSKTSKTFKIKRQTKSSIQFGWGAMHECHISFEILITNGVKAAVCCL